MSNNFGINSEHLKLSLIHLNTKRYYWMPTNLVEPRQVSMRRRIVKLLNCFLNVFLAHFQVEFQSERKIIKQSLN